MQLFQVIYCFTLSLLCLHFALGMKESYCENSLDCNGPNTLCIKNRCMCIMSNKWNEEGNDCNTESTSESPVKNRPEPDVVKVHVQDDKKLPISFYKSASFYASYTIFCIIISILTCYLKILAVRL